MGQSTLRTMRCSITMSSRGREGGGTQFPHVGGNASAGDAGILQRICQGVLEMGHDSGNACVVWTEAQ